MSIVPACADAAATVRPALSRTAMLCLMFIVISPLCQSASGSANRARQLKKLCVANYRCQVNLLRRSLGEGAAPKPIVASYFVTVNWVKGPSPVLGCCFKKSKQEAPIMLPTPHAARARMRLPTVALSLISATWFVQQDQTALLRLREAIRGPIASDQDRAGS